VPEQGLICAPFRAANACRIIALAFPSIFPQYATV